MQKKIAETFIFLHIPKTAGTSLWKSIEADFGKKYNILNIHLIDKKIRAGELPHYTGDRNTFLQQTIAEVEKNTKIDLMVGHYKFGIHQYFNHPAKYFAFVRQPVERFISQYYFLEKSKKTVTQHQEMLKNIHSLEDFAQSPQFFNSQAKFFTGLSENALNQLSEKDFLTHINDIYNKHFFFIGITENFDQSIVVFKEISGFRKLSIQKSNVNKSKPASSTLSPNIISLIQNNNHYDNLLYEFALEKFKELAEKNPPKELSIIQKILQKLPF
ncbi:MAG: sulfotransferase family 2 domain-containing protein [Chitinophagales bacterium]